MIVMNLWEVEDLSKLAFYSFIKPMVPRILARYIFLLWDSSSVFFPSPRAYLPKKNSLKYSDNKLIEKKKKEICIKQFLT